MGERFTGAFIISTRLLIGGAMMIVCFCGILFYHPMVSRFLGNITRIVDSYTMTGTTCEALQTDLAFEREIPPLSAREIQQNDGTNGEPKPPIRYLTPDVPVTSRRIYENTDLSYFYGEDVIACFGNPTYYYAYWQQEPEDQALIVELIYPEAGLIFFSYSLSDWQGNLATLHPKTKFQEVRRIPLIGAKSELAPHLSYVWYDEKPVDPSWVNDAVREWQWWDQIILPE
jgi:hypothetical protein